MSGSANASKSDQGPEDWLPAKAAFRCRCADWVAAIGRALARRIATRRSGGEPRVSASTA